MNLYEYDKKVFNLINDFGSTDENVIHMTLGIVGECAEVTDLVRVSVGTMKVCPRMPIIEEIGDTLFYINGLCRYLHINRDEILKFSEETLTSDGAPFSLNDVFGSMSMCAMAGKLADRVKKTIAYGRQLDIHGITGDLTALMYHTGNLLHDIDSDLSAALETNVRKLEVRYPGLIFTKDRANNRDKDAEANAMKG